MFLEKIVADKLSDIEARKQSLSQTELQRQALAQSPPLSLASALRAHHVQLIAEVKRASPSKGIICPDFDPVAIARNYARSGAAAISILTEERYFQGSLDHLKDIAGDLGNSRPPLLRKDFILDPYQVYESRSYGADGLLLIVAILTPEKLGELLSLSHDLGMDCLVEVHNEAELRTALDSRAKIIGINNRDLKTFAIDLTTTEHLRPLIPPDRIVVSESGISHRSDIEKMQGWGVDAVLIGEALMSAPDITVKVRQLFG